MGKRAFILGAGFSKQAGMPLATELTRLLLERPSLKELDEMQKWLVDLQLRLEAVERVGPKVATFVPSVEQLFDYAKYDEELCRMKQQLCPVGRAFGSTPWEKAEGIQSWLGYMEEDLVATIWEAQVKANRGPIDQFAEHLSGDDTVMTFNYDTLVETALSARKQAWNHGLDDKGTGGVTVLKMHGSVDWILFQRRREKECKAFVKIFSKRDTNVEDHGDHPPQEEEYAWELWRARDTGTRNAVVEIHDFGLTLYYYRLGLAGLGSYKPLHKLPGSAQTWYAAFRVLSEVDEVYVVGFSMSRYDTMMRFHFATVIRDRTDLPPPRVVIIDPNAQTSELAEAASAVFGKNLTLIPRRAEEVNWRDMLGR